MPGRLRTALVLLLTLPATGACDTAFDETRRPPPRGTLGQELYTVLCDRLGAAVFTEDTAGASYRGVCHADSKGDFATQVDESLLPDPNGLPDAAQRVKAVAARRASIAKLEAMASRRVDLTKALDLTFADATLTAPFTAGDSVDGHQALKHLLAQLAPLYDLDPNAPDKEPLMPAATRATARFFAGLGGPGSTDDPFTSGVDRRRATAAREALARLSGRRGYRPSRVALGALRPALAYPRLRALLQAVAPELAPGGASRDAFQDLLGSTQNELATSVVAELPPAWTLSDAQKLQPNRPRTTAEVAAAALLGTDAAYASLGATSRFITLRDTRGWALPTGAVPGTPGSISGPFADRDGDGFADVDGLGRFLAADGTLAAVDAPFVVPGVTSLGSRDAFGRALGSGTTPLYQSLDTSALLVTALTRALAPLFDPDGGVESVVDLLAGSQLLFGAPLERDSAWAEGGKWKSYDAASSPLVGLVHATGQILAHPRSDATLAMVERLFREKPGLLARIVNAALKLRAVSNQHPDAKLAPENPFWDELGDLLVTLLRKPDVFKSVLRSIADPKVNTVLARAFGTYMKYRDLVSYDPQNLNGPPVKLRPGGGSLPDTPVDRSQPDTIVNGVDQRSAFHRILQMIHDMDGVNACNRQGAKVRVKLGGLDLAWPLVGDYRECEVLRINDIGLVYLDSVLDDAYARNPKQGVLKIEDGALSGLVALLGGIGVNIDDVFRESSGITGMSLAPKPRAFHRLVFFGTTSGKYDGYSGFGGQMPDRDPEVNGKNKLTNEFISSLIDPLPTSVCAPRTVQYGGGANERITIRDCSVTNGNPSTPFDTLRLRDRGGIFQWELYDFLTGIAPLANAFDQHGESQLFLDLLQVLYRHWPTERHGPECRKQGTWRKGAPNYDPRYCHESGLARYEPILVELFQGDLLPAFGELLGTIDTAGYVTDVRGNGQPVNGIDLLTEVAEAYLDPAYSASVGLVGVDGKASTTLADGSPKAQATPFDLFANALRAIDTAHANDEARRTRWRGARSRLVDTFLTVEGEGISSKFKDPAVPAAIPALVRVLREQLNANCPAREQGTSCTWAKSDLSTKLKDTMEAPTFGTAMALLDGLDRHQPSRTELQKLLAHLLRQASDDDTSAATLASLSDVLQILGDDRNMPPLYNAIALAAAPGDNAEGAGAADTTLTLLDAMTREADASGAPRENPYDRYRVLDGVLARLVTPMEAGKPDSLTPLDVMLDVIAEVNREDSSLPREEPLSARDFELVFSTLRDFMSSKTRGLEQFYEIVRHRDGK